MRDTVALTGMVLRSSSFREYDRRLVILTRERGKITAFARGVKKPGSALMAVCRPFCFGEFSLYEGRDAYTLRSAQNLKYFEELSADVETACYGSYFLEVADYYGRENLDASGLLLLLYQSLRALLKPSLPNGLVRRIFELRAMAESGEYTSEPPRKVSAAAAYAWNYIITAPPASLYTFVLKQDVERELAACVEDNRRRFLDRNFHSLEVLDAMRGEPGLQSGGFCV